MVVRTKEKEKNDMKYSICETLMWNALTPTMFRWLQMREAETNIKDLKKRAKQVYKDMVRRTPEIGSMRENSLRICLTGGMVWLSVYEAAEGKMSEECFADMVDISMEAPLVKKSFEKKAKTVFTIEGQKKRAENAIKGNALTDSPFNWNTEVILGRDTDEYTINYHRCGLCALGKQENLEHLVKYMCVLDIKSVEWMGGVLYRTQTLATGGEYCDFYICKKDSEWDRSLRRPIRK